MTNADKLRLRRGRNEAIYHIVAIALGVVMLYPLLWMIMSSFKPESEIFGSLSLMPREFTLQNYVRGWAFNNFISFSTFYWNSFVITSISTVGAVLMSSLAAFGFTRVMFRGRGFWYSCMFLTLMLPFQVIMVPQYIMFHRMGWVNTYLPLIIPQWGGQAFFIFMMSQFYRGIPLELDESAMLDGCNKFTIYRRILFPLITPALMTATIFSFYWRWEDFLGPLLYIGGRQRLWTVALGVRAFQDTMGTDWGSIFAMGSLSILPSLIVFFVFQKYIVEGIATTGLKS